MGLSLFCNKLFFSYGLKACAREISTLNVVNLRGCYDFLFLANPAISVSRSVISMNKDFILSITNGFFVNYGNVAFVVSPHSPSTSRS